MPLQNSDDSEGLGFSELSFSKNIISEKFSPKDSCTINNPQTTQIKPTIESKSRVLLFGHSPDKMAASFQRPQIVRRGITF